jgi:uncharacterized membrane protein (TIGR02234 family)
MRPGTRSYLIGLALLVAGGIVCVAIPGRTWATADVEGRLATSQVAVTGRDLLPLAPAAGLLALAAVVATYATRRLGRRLVGVVLLAAGGAVAVWAVRVAVDLRAAASSWLERAPEHEGAVTSTAISPLLAVITAVGGALIALAGLLTVTRGARWPAMGAQYDRPAAGDSSDAKSGSADQPGRATRHDHLGRDAEPGQPERDAEPSEAERDAEPSHASAREVWDALDRGDDPTVSTPPTRPTP